MAIELYAIYSRTDALRALGIQEPSQQEWGGQLVLHPEARALLVTLGPAETAPHFLTPDRFRFRPDRPYSSTGPGNDWMPQALTEHGPEAKALHLFVREGTGDRFRYVGQLNLGMYSLPRDYRQQVADFDLEPRLPREHWVSYGGYLGWKLTLNHREHFLHAGDEAALNAYLAEIGNQEDLHLGLTRYEGDCLTLLANESQAYVTYQNEWGGEELVCNPDHPEDTEEIADFYCSCGAALEMPLCNVIPRPLGLEAVREFFATGVRPNQIAWFEE